MHVIKGTHASCKPRNLKLQDKEMIVAASVDRINEQPVNIAFILYTDTE